MQRGIPSHLLGNFALVGIAVLVGLVISELALRLAGVYYDVFFQTDPHRGVAHIPGVKSVKQYDGHSLIEINHDGLRGPDVPLEHPPGTLRIALLGDSFIEGFQVPFEQTVGEVIARRLSARLRQPVQVLNFGVGGYGTTQELLTLRYEVWKYAPDLVVLGMTTGNDISDNYRPLKRSSYIPYYVFHDSGLVLDTSFLHSSAYRSRSAGQAPILLALLQRSRVAQVVNRVPHAFRKGERQVEFAGEELGLRDEVQLPPITPEWKEAWRVTEAVLRLMGDECRRQHRPFAIVTLTRAVQVTPVAQSRATFLRKLGVEDLYYPERRLSAFGKREDISVLNLAPPMADLALARHVHFHAEVGQLDVGHWNEEGHRVAGELIAAWLAQLLADSVQAPGRSARRGDRRETAARGPRG